MLLRKELGIQLRDCIVLGQNYRVFTTIHSRDISALDVFPKRKYAK